MNILIIEDKETLERKLYISDDEERFIVLSFPDVLTLSITLDHSADISEELLKEQERVARK